MAAPMMTVGETIRRRLGTGSLPRRSPDKMYAGFGSDGPCDGCGRIIPHGEIEYELDYQREMRTYRLHIGCYGIWDIQRLQFAA
jgi:hypothetical protein